MSFLHNRYKYIIRRFFCQELYVRKRPENANKRYWSHLFTYISQFFIQNRRSAAFLQNFPRPPRRFSAPAARRSARGKECVRRRKPPFPSERSAQTMQTKKTAQTDAPVARPRRGARKRAPAARRSVRGKERVRKRKPPFSSERSAQTMQTKKTAQTGALVARPRRAARKIASALRANALL